MLPPATLREIILKSGFVTPKDFDAALQAADELAKDVTDVLIYRGLISEEALGQLIAEFFGVPFVRLGHKVIPAEVLSLIPEEAATSFHLIPYARENNSLRVAMVDPIDLEALEFVRRKTGLKLIPAYASIAEISRAIGQYKRNIKEIFTKIIDENVKRSTTVGVDVAKLASDVPVVTILDTILDYAATEGASDIHFEVMEGSYLVRFRVDGILRDVLTLPKSIHPAIIARIKILSQLKIDEHRVPQDGRFKFKLKDSYISLRVSILPAFYGENMVLRILPESARPQSLEELGITGHNLDLVKANIHKPHGMILVTGPTGSGKTTTLYSLLTILNSTDVKICTVEDPIEYGMTRVNQIQINLTAGLTFAVGLRSLLRHDPDIIMVGEIRDHETAEMAIHSALTGHLVLSTLHTNDAAGTIPRFLDMGAEGFLVATTVNLVIAQRLVRKICPACIEAFEPTDDVITYLTSHLGVPEVPKKYYRGRGCSECGNKGYRGRVGIYEGLEVNEEIRTLIMKRVSGDEILKAAVKNGMIPLLRDGISKASGGMTTIEEVLRVVRE